MTPTFTPLSDLLARGRPSDWPVARHAGHVRAWSELVERVAGLTRVLEGAQGNRWALVTDDAWAFAVGLLAIWQADGVAIIPPNGQAGTLKEIGADVRGIVTDRPGTIVGAEAVPVFGGGAAPLRRWRRLDPEIPRLELYTSGTSGMRRVAVKGVGHIEREVAVHETRWADLVRGAQAIATVSHQHIYGLLFRVAWPLAAGRVFCGAALFQPAEVVAAMTEARAAYLVSTPAHLRRLTQSSSLRRLTSSCRVIFSSGGALDSETARGLKSVLGSAPVEIFGSTETGGVAWRRQDVESPSPWTPFEGVILRVVGDDARLRVRSSWIGEPGEEFTMGDSAELGADGRFLLGARTDRIVKIGEKRLSLPEMEARLHEHPFVGDVALAVLDRRGEARLAAVVVPNSEGAVLLERDGRLGFASTLRRWLEPHWDRVVLPRHWRFVDRLPEDDQGKTSVAALVALFVSRGDS
jgi:acyl-coenzyme A synthetase/AMP-(fatty) acid ligase